MKRWWTLPLVALAVACSDNDNGLSSEDRTQLSEQNEEAAAVVGESIALDSGGVLEAIEATILDEIDAGGLHEAGSGKSRLTDEASFDSTTCFWTLTWARSGEGPYSGFNWSQTKTEHFMDADGDCIVRPGGDGEVAGIDCSRIFAGESWNRRSSGERSGSGEWTLRGLHDDVPGTIVNGVHHREGAGEVTRRGQDGEPVTIEHAFTLDIDAHDLVVLQRRGRRLPVDGWMHIVYHAERGDRIVDREITLVFGEEGGRIAFPNGESYDVDLISGDID